MPGRKSKHTGGFFLAVLGPDGSGKTSIVNALHRCIDKGLFEAVLCYHANVAILPLLKTFKRIFFGENSTQVTQNEIAVQPGMVEPHSLIRSLIYVLYYSVDYCLGWFSIRDAMWKNQLVVFDRYFYDFFYQRQNRKLPHWLLWLISRFVPKPDLVVCLKANPNVIYARKPELSPEEIEIQCDIVGSLASRLPNSVIVRTDQPIERTIQEVESHVVRSLHQRHQSRTK